MNAADIDPAVDYVFTIGHSNQSFEALLANLRRYEIEALVDVRSQPVSKYTPHFNRGDLTWRLQEAGIKYAFMGDTLGGRPDGREFYDEDGHVRYDLWSASDAFQEGIARLLDRASDTRTAIMCAEEDPARCHRHLLIARVMRERVAANRSVMHIRKGGAALPDHEIIRQGELFSVDWRSPMPLEHKNPGAKATSA